MFLLLLVAHARSLHACSSLALSSTPITDWLVQKTVQKVIIVISNANDGATVERWQFDIECDKSANADTSVACLLLLCLPVHAAV